MSGARQRGIEIGRFRLYAEPQTDSPAKYLRRLWIQFGLPVLLLWNQRHQRNVIVTYDAYFSGVAGVLLKLVLGTSLIVEVNGDDQNLRVADHGLARKLAMDALFWMSVTMADAVKVVNSHQETFVRSRFPKKRVYRFPDYVATEYFSSLDTNSGDYLLSVGHPFHLKGMDVLVRAFQHVVKKHPGIRLKIMGHSTPRELAELKALAGRDPRVEFLKPGWIEDVAEQLRGCYAYVSASRREAAGRVVFEAMACAKPVVSSRTNSGNDYVTEGRTGLLFNTGDWQELALKLEQLLDDREKAQAMGRHGFNQIRSEFSESIYIKKFRAMIGDVVA
jgi:glycosyltransferase involved in cell wall biosynthesis